nr:energy-coupling factor transporter transmembrane component T [Streptomonospora salina]
MAGIYVPPRRRRAVLHRLPAGAKIAALVAAVVAVVAAADARVAVAAAAAAALVHPLCGLGVGPALRTLRALAPFVAAIVLFQWLVGDGATAVRVCGQLLAAALLAAAVTASTRVTEMLELFERLARPLARVGANPRRVALVLALTIRCIPMVASAWRTSREAYLARGLRGRPDAMVVPVIVGLLRSADSLGEALTARGID